MAASFSPDRIVPLVSIRRYLRGQADETLNGKVFAFHDIPAETYRFGTPEYHTDGSSLLEMQPEVGLICRGFLKWQDTRSSHVSTSGGTWDESRPAGAGRKYRIYQVDTTADLQWSATSTYWLPAYPEFAFTLHIPDTPPDHDVSTYPPYVRLEFGNRPAEWALDFSKVYGNRLLFRYLGTWRVLADLPGLEANQDSEESLVVLRCIRGRIGVSMDAGRTYTWHGSDEITDNVVPGPWVLRGQGHAVGFGIHQLEMAEGDYLSPPRPTFTSTWFSSPILTTWGYAGSGVGGAVSVVDATSSWQGAAGYRATLTPGTVTGGGKPWTFYHTPYLAGVTFRYASSRIGLTGIGLYELPWDGRAFSLDIHKPFELDEGTADLIIQLDPDVAFEWDSGRWPALEIRAGWLDANSVENWWTVFAGYAEIVRPEAEEYRATTLTLRLHNRSVRFKEVEYSEFDRYPLGGQTVNAALDSILDSEGLTSTDRTWFSVGDYVTLPLGLPEDPGFYPRRGDTKWHWMTEIAKFAGLEIGCLDDGRFATLPRNYVDGYVSLQWDATPSSDLGALVHRASNTLDSRESASCVIVYGQDYAGQRLVAFGVDTQAEENAFSSRFTPWRKTIQEEIPYPTTLGALVSYAQGLAISWFGNKYDVELTAPIVLAAGRRQRAQVLNSGFVGVTDYNQWAVLTMDHHIEHDPSFTRVSTRVGLRRLD